MRKSLRNIAQPKKVYRFKLWTRKSYSVFNSLGKLVSIGVLAVTLSEKLGSKTRSVESNTETFQQKDIPSDGEPGENPDMLTKAFEHILYTLFAPLLFLAINKEAGSPRGKRVEHSFRDTFTSIVCRLSPSRFFYIPAFLSVPSSYQIFDFQSLKTFNLPQIDLNKFQFIFSTTNLYGYVT